MDQAAGPAIGVSVAGRTRRRKRLLAWGVHLYTALGLVAAAGMAVLIVRGGDEAFLRAFMLMLVATVIDATDGALARAAQVKKVLPGFDGRRLDDIIDFLTYTALPLLLVWRAGILPEGQEGWLLLPLLASAYGFCQVHAKTDDGYFLGFPSYWNLVAFYLYLLHFHVAPLPGWLSLSLILWFALLTFVPTRYLYPTQRGRLNRLTNFLGAVWACLLVWVLYRLRAGGAGGTPAERDFTAGLILLSLAFPVYYLVASWAISWRLWRVGRTLRAARGAKR
jgi:phosphatidylcholine synthase